MPVNLTQNVTSVASDYFSLNINFLEKSTDLVMTVKESFISTKDLENVREVLAGKLPSIFKSRCFNNKNLPFKEEVKDTELGHLLEHIILEYLCILKLSEGSAKKVVFNGLTNWNWKVYPRGTFHITIDCPFNDFLLFQEAAIRSVKLLEEILGYHRETATES